MFFLINTVTVYLSEVNDPGKLPRAALINIKLGSGPTLHLSSQYKKPGGTQGEK